MTTASGIKTGALVSGPVGSPLGQILATIAGHPRMPSELAQDLGSSAQALEGMLTTLHVGGYVQEAVQGAGDCSCGPCALKSLCRNADGSAPPLNLLRLTPRGEAYLRRLNTKADAR